MGIRGFVVILTVLIFALVSGCATPMSYSDKPLSVYDKDTEYVVDDREGGFAVTVYYSRYQFIPESDALAVACKSALTSIAYDHADKVGRKIEPINEQRIRISMGRNGFSGITSCAATAIAVWQK